MSKDGNKDFLPAEVQRDFFHDSSCIIDSYTADLSSTIDKKETKITLDSDTAQPDQYYLTKYGKRQYTPGTTTCAWTYGGFLDRVRINLILNKFEVPGCNDCSCGSLDIYAATYRQLNLLERICSHNKTNGLSFNTDDHPIDEDLSISNVYLLIQFKSNVTLPKKLEIDISTSRITEYGNLT